MIATCWPSLYRPAEGRAVSFAAVLARVRAPRMCARKEDAPRVALAEFRDGYRDLARFIRAHGIMLDFDTGSTSRAQIIDAFGDLAGFAHTTWTPGRWRVALMLDRATDADEFPRVQRAAIDHAERHGLHPELHQSAAHCFALPSLGGAPYEHVELTGALFDVDAALERFPRPAPLPPPARSERTDTYEHRLERAAKYLAAMPGAISGSGGHAATFKAAVVLVKGFALEPDDALQLLATEFNPRCAPPWSLYELRHKVRQAVQRGRLDHGYLADRRAV